MTNVVAIHGGPSGAPEVNQHCVDVLQECLERARSGDLIGVALVFLHGDAAVSRIMAGTVGRNAMIGALEASKFDMLLARHVEHDE